MSENNFVLKDQLITTIILLGATVSGFFAIEQYVALQMLKGKEFWNPSLQWDQFIPLSPGWVWVYLIYFPLVFLPVLWKEIWEDKIAFRKAAIGMGLLYATSFAIFGIFSTHIVRPVLEPDGLNGRVLEFIYKIDSGFNIFPSLHVANVAYVACIAGWLKKKALSSVIWILCFLIAISTLFIKQHYILDLPSGLLMGIACYYIAFSGKP